MYKLNKFFLQRKWLAQSGLNKKNNKFLQLHKNIAIKSASALNLSLENIKKRTMLGCALFRPRYAEGCVRSISLGKVDGWISRYICPAGPRGL